MIDDFEYGSDLLIGIIELECEDVLMVYGDVWVRGIGEVLAVRAFGTNFFAIEWWKMVLVYVKNVWDGGFVGVLSDGVFVVVDVVRVFMDELRNLTSFAGSAAAFVAATLASLVMLNGVENGFVDVVGVFFVFLLFCLFVEMLWMERDEVLCVNALNVVDVCSGIVRGRVRCV